jgi:hypothetical protein
VRLRQASDDEEVVDDRAASEVEEALAGAAIAGAAPLPATDVSEGVLDGHSLTELGPALRKLSPEAR